MMGVAMASAGPYVNHLYLALADNHSSALSLTSFIDQVLFTMPNQQWQNTEDKTKKQR